MKTLLKKSLCMVLACLMLFGCMAVGASADEVKRISCSMYADGATSRGFCWYTLEDGNSDLQLVTEAEYLVSGFSNAVSYVGKTEEFRDQFAHKVVVEDLTAGTSYCYRVGDAEKNMWSDTCSFTTDDGDNAFSFITIADVQASSNENFAQAAKVMKAAMDTMPEAEFVVTLGDFVNDNTNDEWDWYFKNFAFANNNTTLVPVAGNHDGNITNKLNTYVFQNTFCLDESDNQSLEGVYYSFDYGDAHIAVLNTNDMYPMSQAQKNWLINDMKTSDAKWKLVFMHRALYSAGKNINKPDTIILRNTLIPIFDEIDIDFVMAGHDHMYMRTAPVYADARTEVTTVTESYNGVSTTFALNPEGAVHVLPSTAGTKRYSVNEDAIAPIMDVAEIALSTSDLGGCFATTTIDGDYLIYTAYVVDDETQEITQIDTYAIKKTDKNEVQDSELDESMATSFFNYLYNLFYAIIDMIKSYLGILF
ncbi:MAG: metallophosphoesterase family protein [Clostridia bacterium]|nr:metallophosphoesterase family protein [Clostridia bacterium]